MPKFNQITLLLLAVAQTFLITSCSKEKDAVKTVAEPWHGIKREVRYQPDGETFVITNGTRRFNRALYGSDTGFRAEAGDLPEFALYLPGYGGTIKLAILKGENSKWLIEADEIQARYVPGSMYYEVRDELLDGGSLKLGIIALFEGEGMVLKIDGDDVPDNVKVAWAYGGGTGKKFSRDGDIGADPESVFYLKPEHCEENEFRISENSFEYFFGAGVIDEGDPYVNVYDIAPKDRKGRPIIKKHLTGTVSQSSDLQIADANNIEDPSGLIESTGEDRPVLTGTVNDLNETYYLGIFNPDNAELTTDNLADAFAKADEQRAKIASRVKVNTPDPYMNTLGGALAIAADGVWEYPSFQHGAIAWRMALLGWRGMYAADWLGQHDRARTHYSAYAKSQYTEPATEPSRMDPGKHLARQVEEKGTELYSSGYFSRYPGKPNRPHHYDMNLVYIDGLLRHFDWTGDSSYIKEMWPVLKRHFDWEERNFDPDDDGLYNAYASIWASDALDYNGGGVAHSSAYNHYALQRAAEIAGDLPYAEQYLKEAEKIKKALNEELWMPEKGTFAEYKDNLGNELLHPQTGAWSVYHLMDSEVPDPFQAYQMLRYVDTEIPHIPMVVRGMPEDEYYTISTTNWMPYTWSVNNVALAETMHTALAYWQGGVKEEAYTLFKSALMESMYNGASPGNFQQLSFYDAMRSELYRDFADPIAMTARGLVEGLFGVKPRLLQNTLFIEPGLPEEWDFATLETADLTLDYKRDGMKDKYTIINHLDVETLALTIPARGSELEHLKSSSKPSIDPGFKAIANPKFTIRIPMSDTVEIEVEWGGDPVFNMKDPIKVAAGTGYKIEESGFEIREVYDPQGVFVDSTDWEIGESEGFKTVFARIAQGDLHWWEPINFEVVKPVALAYDFEQPKGKLAFELSNNYLLNLDLALSVNGEKSRDFNLPKGKSKLVSISESIKPGTNIIKISNEILGDEEFEVINWDIAAPEIETVDISAAFNDKVTNIFKNEYLSPRSPHPTLQLPIHGLGDWCSHGAYMEIVDDGLRGLVDENSEFALPGGIKFQTPQNGENILFVSQWDNYPNEATVDLSGNASHAYLLMAGSTNPMQSRLENGFVEVRYTDGSSDVLELRNPETWWPIEQDYYIDGYAFDIDYPKPYRVHLKTGWIGRDYEGEYESIGSFTKYAIDGGAATVYDLPLNKSKELESLEVRANTIDVVIGLMGISLVR